MDEGIHRENRETLSKVASTLSIPYVFMGIVGVLYALYSSSFISQDIGGVLVVGLLCLLTPMLTGATANFFVRPVLSNILGNDIISNRGCLAGLGVYGAMVLAVIFFLTRNFATASYIFLAVPVVAILTSVVVSGIGRMGGGSGKRGAGPISISRPQPPRIGTPPHRHDLPPGEQSPGFPSRLPGPRRSAVPKPPTRPSLPPNKRP